MNAAGARRYFLTLFTLLMAAPLALAQDAQCASDEPLLIKLAPARWDEPVPPALHAQQLLFSDDFWRVWAWGELQRAWPCSALSMTLSDPYSGATRTLGAKGEAAYEIRSQARSVTAPARVPVLHVSGWNGESHTRAVAELVMPVARIKVELQLVALDSGSVADTGEFLVDLVPLPPGDDLYIPPPGPLTIVDNRAYTPADAIFWDGWTPEPLAGHLPNLEMGDPGSRLPETPSASAEQETVFAQVDREDYSHWLSIGTATRRHRDDMQATETDQGTRITTLKLEERREASFFVVLDGEPRVELTGRGRELHTYKVREVLLTGGHLESIRDEHVITETEHPVRFSRCERVNGGSFQSPEAASDGSGARLSISLNTETGEILRIHPPKWTVNISWSGESTCEVLEYDAEADPREAWKMTRHTGASEAPDRLTTLVDSVVVAALGEDESCYSPVPQQALDQHHGSCAAHETRNGVEQESSYTWTLHLPFN